VLDEIELELLAILDNVVAEDETTTKSLLPPPPPPQACSSTTAITHKRLLTDIQNSYLIIVNKFQYNLEPLAVAHQQALTNPNDITH
jgi:hypothetical protein